MVKGIKYRVGMLLVDEENDVWEITKIDNNSFIVKPLNERHNVRKYTDRSICRAFRPFCLQVGEVFNFSNAQYTFHGVEYKATKIGGVCLFKIKGTNGYLYITRTMLYNYI